MNLEDRLERLAARTAPGDPTEVLAGARARAGAGTGRRTGSPRLLAAAAAVVAVLALAVGALAVTGGDDHDSVTLAGPDRTGAVEGEWRLVTTVRGGQRQPARAEATLTIEGDTVTGDDGCGNAIQARLGDRRITFDGMHTVAGCIDDEANDDAIHFWDVIERSPSHELREGDLWLLADRGNALVFTPVGGRSGAVPTYDLDLAGAELVEDNSHTAASTDVVLWSDGRGTYLSLTARPPGSHTPGAGATVPDETFPADRGKAWLSEPDDPRAASMWWVQPSGDPWMLHAYWYGDSTPDDPEAALRAWALDISYDDDASPPYELRTGDLVAAAYEAAGERPARSRVWTYQGHEITLLVIQSSSAAGQTNLLDRGAPAFTEVPRLGEVWAVGSTFGWDVPRPKGTWATLTVPDALSGRAQEILAALRPR